MTRHLAEERRRVLAQRQREVREMQHSAKMDAIQDRRDRKELATMKLEAEKRAKTRGGVNLVPGTMLVGMGGGGGGGGGALGMAVA